MLYKNGAHKGLIFLDTKYSLTCIKRPLKGRMKKGLLIEVVS